MSERACCSCGTLSSGAEPERPCLTLAASLLLSLLQPSSYISQLHTNILRAILSIKSGRSRKGRIAGWLELVSGDPKTSTA